MSEKQGKKTRNKASIKGATDVKHNKFVNEIIEEKDDFCLMDDLYHIVSSKGSVTDKQYQYLSDEDYDSDAVKEDLEIYDQQKGLNLH